MDALTKDGGLRVCVDARAPDGIGGTQQVMIGLASALSQLTDGDEEYLFLVEKAFRGWEWVRSYLHGPCRVLEPRRQAGQSRRTFLQRVGRFPGTRWMRWMRERYPNLPGMGVSAPAESDGTIEAAGVEVMHFTQQSGFRTRVPSIYMPYDLQHVHLPEFFTRREVATREQNYGIMCRQAEIVVALTKAGKRDLVEHYGLPEERVQVVSMAPVLTAYPTPGAADLAAARERLRLPEAFAFYPAQTWRHKNHLGLLEAVAWLRDERGVKVEVVCSGMKNAYFEVIQQRLTRLRLEGQVRFVGFVSPMELQALYRLARCMVFPSKFEGWGMPLTEAFMVGTAAVCSNVPPLSDQAGDAAVVFDPGNTRAMGEAILRVWSDEGLRRTLIERGRANAARFSWDRAARTFRACYRKVAGRKMTEEDVQLITAEPLC